MEGPESPAEAHLGRSGTFLLLFHLMVETKDALVPLCRSQMLPRVITGTKDSPHTGPCRIRGQVTPSTAACLTESAPEGSALQEPLGIPLSMSPNPSTFGGKERAGRLTHSYRSQQKVQEYKEEQSTPHFFTSLGLEGGRTLTLW